MVILKGNDVTLRWTIIKCLDGSEVPEDFSSSELSVVVQSTYSRAKINVSVDGNVIIIPILGNAQQCGKISLEAVWSKNEGKNWSRAKQVDVIEFTDDPNRVTPCGSGVNIDVHTISFKSAMFGAVGHDGLTPFVGSNGNWWIGIIDTRVPATGPRGDAFTFDDFTPTQILELQKPALDAAESVSQSIEEVEELLLKGRILEADLVQLNSDIENLLALKEDKASKQIISDVEYEELVDSGEILPDVLYYTYES